MRAITAWARRPANGDGRLAEVPGVDLLTPREREVLRYLTRGLHAKEIGEQLGITDELANKLTLAGGFNPEMIVDMPSEYIASALEITPEAADAILARAQSLVSGGEAVTSND